MLLADLEGKEAQPSHMQWHEVPLMARLSLMTCITEYVSEVRALNTSVPSQMYILYCLGTNILATSNIHEASIKPDTFFGI